jgi:hypothetical protein
MGLPPGQRLPAIAYVAGCLKDVHIREALRNILEGGGAAFRERARRLRLRVGPDGRLNSDLDQSLGEWAEILRILEKFVTTYLRRVVFNSERNLHMFSHLLALLFLTVFAASGIVFLIWVLYHLQMDSSGRRHR